MSRKPKYSSELKVKACEQYLNGKLSMPEICKLYGISYNEKNYSCSIYDWLHVYRKLGADGFINQVENKSYSKEFKKHVVNEYLSGAVSTKQLAAKYKIKSDSTLRQWILMYNANKELKDYDPKREVYMAEARRKTTIEERKEIVEYCINHRRNYKDTASKFNVSYSQVYSWIKKYDTNGEEALLDKRGHHKTDDELDELERLRRENLRLKRELEEKDMLTELLKKVKEFERM
ncbi:MAG: transposase [Cellulosilyticaceae bacterium]